MNKRFQKTSKTETITIVDTDGGEVEIELRELTIPQTEAYLTRLLQSQSVVSGENGAENKLQFNMGDIAGRATFVVAMGSYNLTMDRPITMEEIHRDWSWDAVKYANRVILEMSGLLGEAKETEKN